MNRRFGYIKGGSNTMDARVFIGADGKPKEVLLTFEDYEALMERLEDAEALEFIRKFKNESHEYVSLDEALAGLSPNV
jgi:PHD/YefM family antitoxin component YafN of YafNO toxin-antitoxin module